MSEIIHDTTIKLKNKTILLRIYRNQRGAFVALTEARGRNNTSIFIPAEEYYTVLEAMHDITLEVARVADLPF